jgi:hypothetical protein
MTHLALETEIVLAVLAVFAFPLLWVMVIVPLIARRFDVPYRIGALPFDREIERLSGWQSFWFAGVLAWGFGMFLLVAETQLFFDPTHPTLAKLLYELVGCLVFGGLWNQAHNRTLKANHHVGR